MDNNVGASYSVISGATRKRLWPQEWLMPTTVKLCACTGEPLVAYSKREHDGSSPLWRQKGKVSLLVLMDDGPSLLGRDWLQHLKLDWQQINKLHSETLLQVLQRHEDIFKDGLGTLEGYKVKIRITPGVLLGFTRHIH